MKLPHLMRRFFMALARREQEGVAAIEFALYATVFLIVLAGTVDIGNLIFSEFQLDNAVEAGAEYALVNNANATSSSGATLANSVSAIVNNGHGSGWSNTVVVNNGPSTTTSNGSATASGSASNAASCYCPTGSAGSWTWGTAKTCSSSCTGGGTAGVFVSIVATRSITPFFPGWGFVTNSTTLSRSAMVQVAVTAN